MINQNINVQQGGMNIFAYNSENEAENKIKRVQLLCICHTVYCILKSYKNSDIATIAKRAKQNTST